VNHHPPPQEQLAVLADVVRKVARSRRLTPEDIDDFTQIVQVRLIETNYDLFHRFTGRSSLRTYLTVVVTRLLLDWLNASYGKWRPSAAASRLGADAVRLDRLMWRDGYTLDQAVMIVAKDQRPAEVRALRAIARQLPPRVRRRRVSEAALDLHRSVEFDDPLEMAERQRAKQAATQALLGALQALPSEDRSLLRLRYERRLSVKVIAEILRVEPKRLYRRFEWLLRRLRRALIAAGVTGPDSIEIDACFRMRPAYVSSARHASLPPG
jgi:RNA polymerase sigma factor (sigma-70 family)